MRGRAHTDLHDLQTTADGRLEIEHVDITVAEQATSLRQRLSSRTFDPLFVNAGVTNSPQETSAEVTTEVPRGFSDSGYGWSAQMSDSAMTRVKRVFIPEFRENAVRLVIDSSRPVASVARKLQIGEGTMGPG